MDIQAEKLSLIEWIAQLSDKQVIGKIIALREGKPDWWQSISAAERAEIEKGLTEADADQLKGHEEVMAKYGKWG